MNEKAKIAVLVSGGGTNLQAIIDAEKTGIIKSGKVELVISNNADAYALKRAESAGIETLVVLRKSYAGRSEFEQAVISALDEHGIDLIILAGFMCILSRDFTDHYKRRIINVHPSLIPSFCGEGYYGLRVHEGCFEGSAHLAVSLLSVLNSRLTMILRGRLLRTACS